jgi:hypothetical protein
MSLRDYIAELGGADPLIQKSEKQQAVARTLCPETIADFFMSESLKEDGQRIFESLWFVSPKYLLECKRILSEVFNIDIACTYKSIEHLEVTYVDFDPLQPQTTTDHSRLSAEATIGMVLCTLKASGSNCTRLWRIIERNMRPNLVELVEIPARVRR